MADKQEGQKPKRRLRSAPVVTVRDRAGNAKAAKPSRIGRVLAPIGRPLRPVGRVIAIISRFVIPPYFRNSFRELRLVTWPNRRESWRLTYAVLLFSIVFGGLIAIVDYGLDKLFKEVLLK